MLGRKGPSVKRIFFTVKGRNGEPNLKEGKTRRTHEEKKQVEEEEGQYPHYKIEWLKHLSLMTSKRPYPYPKTIPSCLERKRIPQGYPSIKKKR